MVETCVKLFCKVVKTRVEIVSGSSENTRKNWCKSDYLKHGVDWS